MIAILARLAILGSSFVLQTVLSYTLLFPS